MEQLSDEQQAIISHTKNNDGLVLVDAKAGCVDKDTEYLTRSGWKKISEYKGEEILVWDTDYSTRFEYPFSYTKHKTDTLYEVKTKSFYGVFSADHRMPYIGPRSKKIEVKLFKDLTKLSTATIPRIFKTPSNINTKLDISDELLRVVIMTSADGSRINSSNKFRINVKKQRKKERVIKLLEDAGIQYKIYNYKEIRGLRILDKVSGREWRNCSRYGNKFFKST